MLFALLGLTLGIITALIADISFPLEYTKYTAVIILGIIDSIIGAIRAETTGISKKDEYSALIFSTGMLSNIILGLGITLLGEKLGLDLYLAATVVFTFRIFRNIGKTRRGLIDKYYETKNKNN